MRKLSFFVSIFLISIISASACSLAIPESVYISNVSLTSDPDVILVDVLDQDFQKWELLYNVEANEIVELTDPVDTITGTPEGLIQKHGSLVTRNSSGVFWKLDDVNSNIIFNLDLNLTSSTSVEFNSEPVHFVSDKLQTAYLILPHDFYQPDGERATVVLSTVVIVPLDGSQINYSFVGHSYLTESYYLDQNRFEVYDEQQLFYLHGNGADCVNGIFFNYSATSFDFLVQSSAHQDAIVDHRTGQLVLTSYNWQTLISEIRVINLDTNTEQIKEISDTELLELLNIDGEHSTSDPFTSIPETVTADLPNFLLIGSVIVLSAMSITRKVRS